MRRSAGSEVQGAKCRSELDGTWEARVAEDRAESRTFENNEEEHIRNK